MAPLNITRMWESANALILKNDVVGMKRLLKNGFPVKRKNQKYSLFVTSSKLGRLEMAKLLLKSGVSINERCQRGNSALDWAIYNNDLSMFDFLIKQKNIDLTQGDPDLGMNPLMFAVKLGDVELVTLLLKRGLDPLSTDKFGQNALHYCMAARSEEDDRIERAKKEFSIDCVFSHPRYLRFKSTS